MRDAAGDRYADIELQHADVRVRRHRRPRRHARDDGAAVRADAPTSWRPTPTPGSAPSSRSPTTSRPAASAGTRPTWSCRAPTPCGRPRPSWPRWPAPDRRGRRDDACPSPARGGSPSSTGWRPTPSTTCASAAWRRARRQSAAAGPSRRAPSPARYDELPGEADAVVVATPPAPAPARGRTGRRRRTPPALVETPLAATLADADALVALGRPGPGGLRREPGPLPRRGRGRRRLPAHR